MAKDVETYLTELQEAMSASGADPALVQDALFDAEEYLRAEMTVGGPVEPGTATYAKRFAACVEQYGTAVEVAAAYLGTPRATPTSAAVPDSAAAPASAAVVSPVPEAAIVGEAPVPAGVPAGVAAGAAAAGGSETGPTRPSPWRRVFGVVVDPAVYKAMLYMLISLATGITYFTVVVTGVSTAGGMLVLIIGIPLFLLVLGLVRGMALVEGRLVEELLGTRMPRRERAELPGADWLQRVGFWVKDGRTWASMAYMILMLPIGIAYFTIAVAGIGGAAGLIAMPFGSWAGRSEFVWHGISHTWEFPIWGAPFAVIAGLALLLLWLHVIRWIGRGHAAFAKHMLVRLAS